MDYFKQLVVSKLKIFFNTEKKELLISGYIKTQSTVFFTLSKSEREPSILRDYSYVNNNKNHQNIDFKRYK